MFLVGIVAAMAVTQHLRSEGPVAERILLRDKPRAPDRICFETPRDDTYEVAMVDIDDQVVRVLAKDVELQGDPALGEDVRHCYEWDGLDDSGEPVPPGAYRLQLTLEDADRTAISGEKLIVPEGEQGG